MQLPALDQDSRNTGTAVWIFDIFSPAAWVAGPALYDRAGGSVGDLAAASRPAPGHGNKEQSRVSPRHRRVVSTGLAASSLATVRLWRMVDSIARSSHKTASCFCLPSSGEKWEHVQLVRPPLGWARRAARYIHILVIVHIFKYLGWKKMSAGCYLHLFIWIFDLPFDRQTPECVDWVAWNLVTSLSTPPHTFIRVLNNWLKWRTLIQPKHEPVYFISLFPATDGVSSWPLYLAPHLCGSKTLHDLVSNNAASYSNWCSPNVTSM